MRVIAARSALSPSCSPEPIARTLPDWIAFFIFSFSSLLSVPEDGMAGCSIYAMLMLQPQSPVAIRSTPSSPSTPVLRLLPLRSRPTYTHTKATAAFRLHPRFA